MTIAFDYLKRLNGVWSNLVLDILERDPVHRKVDQAILERFFLSLNDVLLTNDWHPFETFVDQWLQAMRFGQEKVDFDTYVDLSLVSLLHTFQGA
ncbi:MAG: hypothetical protein ACK2T2_15835, partial [Anaerolineales bacterium]